MLLLYPYQDRRLYDRGTTLSGSDVWAFLDKPFADLVRVNLRDHIPVHALEGQGVEPIALFLRLLRLLPHACHYPLGLCLLGP